jgi:hypothetical protein
MQVDAEAPEVRGAEGSVGDAALDGGAPATSSRSLADRSTTCPSQPRRRAVSATSFIPARRALGAPAFSSVTSASRSS